MKSVGGLSFAPLRKGEAMRDLGHLCFFPQCSLARSLAQM